MGLKGTRPVQTRASNDAGPTGYSYRSRVSRRRAYFGSSLNPAAAVVDTYLVFFVHGAMARMHEIWAYWRTLSPKAVKAVVI